MSIKCGWCERAITTAVEADGRKFCGRICAAQSLWMSEVEENNITNDHGAIDALFDPNHMRDGITNYAVKIRDVDAEDFDPSASGREGFFPITTVIDDGCLPDWKPRRNSNSIPRAARRIKL